MQVVFPGWAASGDKQKQWVEWKETHSDQPKSEKPTFKKYEFFVLPEFVIRLKEDSAILITHSESPETMKAREEGGFLTPEEIAIGAYWFKKVGENWYLDKRLDEAISIRGDLVDVIRISKQGYALVVGSFYKAMGYDIEYINFLEVYDGGLRFMMDDPIYSHADNLYKSSDCDKLFSLQPGQSILEKASPKSHDVCFEDEGKWKIAAEGDQPGDLIVKVNGKHEVSVDLGAETVDDEVDKGNDVDHTFRRSWKPVSGKIVYQYQGGKYIFHSSTNPEISLSH